jgi:hypothetical protein
MKKSLLVGLILTGLILLVVFFLQNSGTSSFEEIDTFEGEVDIYKSTTCGCCLIYLQYFDSKTSPKVNAINMQDLNPIREQYGIPSELKSCHTTIVGDYFVEGHIPLEAIEKLLKEKPDIAGIAMPGMPSGSPGMPGQKYGDFIIYAVNHDGNYSEFMRI